MTTLQVIESKLEKLETQFKQVQKDFNKKGADYKALGLMEDMISDQIKDLLDVREVYLGDHFEDADETYSLNYQ